MIVEETWLHLTAKNLEITEHLFIEDVRFGAHLCAVKLSDGSFGISSTIEDSQIHCDRKHRDFGDFTPLHITGKSVKELFETSKLSAIIVMLRLACLNAISSSELSKYKVLTNTDPYDLLEITPDTKLIIVGAFHSYIEKSLKKGCAFGVLEMNREALNPEHRHLYIPAADYAKVIPGADVVIITGLTLVNNTLENLLDVVGENTKVVVTGPSSSIIPDVLFQKKVDVIGGTKITRPEVLLDLVSQGAAGYHLFTYCAEKISILK